MLRNYPILFCMLLVMGLDVASQVDTNCPDGQNYYTVCDYCFCNKGEENCEMAKCIHPKYLNDSEKSPPPEPECPNGRIYCRGGNYCGCENGQVGCTWTGCPWEE